MTRPVLTITGISFSYPGRSVFEGADLELLPGSFCIVEGPNGSGKSTLLKLILGEKSPSAGSVEVLGRRASSEAAGIVGYVPQEAPDGYRTFPITVLELVQSGLYSRSRLFMPYGRHLRSEARRAIEEVGLGGREKLLVGELSGGQLQRALLARALCAHPDLLVLDEPTSNLDGEAATALVRIVDARVREEGMAALMVTHDLSRLPKLYDRVVRLQDGKIHAITGTER